MLSEKQLLTQLANIVDASVTPGAEIGVLTTENRDTWGKVYQDIIEGSIDPNFVHTDTDLIIANFRSYE